MSKNRKIAYLLKHLDNVHRDLYQKSEDFEKIDEEISKELERISFKVLEAAENIEIIKTQKK